MREIGLVQVIRVRVNRVKMTEKGGEIRGKLDLVQVIRVPDVGALL